MITIFYIMFGTILIKCIATATQTVCDLDNFMTIGKLTSLGLLELVFEIKGLILIFRQKND